jgi:hypothetical protein
VTPTALGTARLCAAADALWRDGRLNTGVFVAEVVPSARCPLRVVR